MNVVIFDYGVGNLYSLAEAFEACGARVRTEQTVGAALQGDALVLPGVGAFSAAVVHLERDRAVLRAALLAGHPCLGVCLGMQLLFEGSAEGAGAGIGVLPGQVKPLRATCLPHMGWNDVDTGPDPLFDGAFGLNAYFAHSYAAVGLAPTNVIGWTTYDGERFPAAVRRGRTWGVQFHPEKSGSDGWRLISNFIKAVTP